MGKDREALTSPRKEVLTASIKACFENGERLLDDADHMDYREPRSTKLVLSMIAQEEFAKAFLLYLVREDIVPWSRELLRAMRDHACKQLVGVIMEYVDPVWDTIDEYRRILDAEYELGGRLPPKIASAVNILRHEKMRRWERDNWSWREEPEYDPLVLAIAQGKRDRVKQSGLYVSLGMDGRVTNRPNSVTAECADAEYALANRYRWLVYTLLEHEKQSSFLFEKLREVLKALFGDPSAATVAA